jgi:hypothetical protein
VALWLPNALLLPDEDACELLELDACALLCPFCDVLPDDDWLFVWLTATPTSNAPATMPIRI